MRVYRKLNRKNGKGGVVKKKRVLITESREYTVGGGKASGVPKNNCGSNRWSKTRLKRILQKNPPNVHWKKTGERKKNHGRITGGGEKVKTRWGVLGERGPKKREKW